MKYLIVLTVAIIFAAPLFALPAQLSSPQQYATSEDDHIVPFHPVTNEEYNAILDLTKEKATISEARLFASGLATILGIASGVKTGAITAIHSKLQPLYNSVVDKTGHTLNHLSGIIGIANTAMHYPLCVVHSLSPGGRSILPAIRCVVVLENPSSHTTTPSMQLAISPSTVSTSIDDKNFVIDQSNTSDLENIHSMESVINSSPSAAISTEVANIAFKPSSAFSPFTFIKPHLYYPHFLYPFKVGHQQFVELPVGNSESYSSQNYGHYPQFYRNYLRNPEVPLYPASNDPWHSHVEYRQHYSNHLGKPHHPVHETYFKAERQLHSKPPTESHQVGVLRNFDPKLQKHTDATSVDDDETHVKVVSIPEKKPEQ